MDEQHNRDEEAAWNHIKKQKWESLDQDGVEENSRIQKSMSEDFLAGIAHCRETEVKGLKAENMCDACCGEGRALSGPCMCGGTGKMSDAARHLRIELYKSREQLRVAVEALKFYAERMSYSMDWDTSDRGVSRRVILYSDQEEINEATIIAGKRAREALQKIEAMKGGGDE